MNTNRHGLITVRNWSVKKNAQAAFDKLSSMVSGEIYGEEAVKAYADGKGVYECHFTQQVAKLEFDGDDSVIKGYVANSNII